MKKILILLLCISTTVQMHAVTLVYSMKIRRSFDAQRFLSEQGHKDFLLLTALPIVYVRTRDLSPAAQLCVHEKTHVLGSIFNARYITSSHWWAEATTAIENQKNWYTGSEKFNISKTGLDDIVLSGGKNFFFRDGKGQTALYGVIGLPTKSSITPQEKYDGLVGTYFFTAGCGGEVSYSFVREREYSLTSIMQLRFLHSFDRDYFPVLPCNAIIQPGNVTDFFYIMQYRHRKNVLEMGYNPTFFTNQAVINAGKKTCAPHAVRNSFYFNMSHLFKESFLLKKPGVIGTGFNISKTTFANTKIGVWWFGLTLLF